MTARLMLSTGILTPLASEIAFRKRGFPSGAAPPMRAAIVISLISFVKARPRFEAMAAFWCLILCHLEWPDINAPWETLLDNVHFGSSQFFIRIENYQNENYRNEHCQILSLLLRIRVGLVLVFRVKSRRFCAGRRGGGSGFVAVLDLISERQFDAGLEFLVVLVFDNLPDALFSAGEIQSVHGARVGGEPVFVDLFAIGFKSRK